MKSKKLEQGQEVTINVPFVYEVGQECPVTGNELNTIEEIKDLSVIIVGDLVIQGLIKDCTDTDDETEFEIQDCIVETLCKKFKVRNDE